MKSMLLISFVFFVLKVLGDPVQTTVTMEPISTDLTWRRVVDRVELTYTYNIVDDNQWNQFPDMAIKIDLPFSQYVKIQYNIQNYLPKISSGHFCTKVIIDGGEPYRDFRITTNGDSHHNHQISREVYLQKGVHRISVLYRTNTMRVEGQGLQNWSCAIFAVTHHQYPTTS